MELNELINFELNEAIQEELGIADAVKDEGFRLSNKIKEIIKGNPTSKRQILDGVIRSSFDFSDTIMGDLFRLSVYYYNFLTRDSFEDNQYKVDYNSASLTSDGKRVRFLFVHCYGISGGLDMSSLSDSVYHELGHYYQGMSGNSEVFNDSPEYMAASTYMQSNIEFEKIISILYYYSRRFEDDGYVNGLYGALISSDNPVPRYEDLKNNGILDSVRQFRNAINIVSENLENKEYQGFCKKIFGITLDKLLKISLTSYYRFLNKIGKVLIKVRQDKINEGIHFGFTTTGERIPLIY